jgi:putative flavoprotein involved in K+ transport
VYVNTVVIGAGHAGLAISRCLSDRGVEHVVLERGRAAERWRTARWDSFRLITPAWMLRLPGHAYRDRHPDAYLTAPELVSYLDDYARSFGAPVREATTVTDVSQSGSGYLVRTDRGEWRSANVVIATGYHSRPRIPALAAGLPGGILQLNPATYRRPEALPAGAVLIVGASASGVQFADELNAAGREVTLAVGAHTALPRRYRDRDILVWLDRIGSLDRTIDDTPDPATALHEPSLQLAGSDRRVDLGELQERGVRLAGRLVRAGAAEVHFADDLATTTAVAAARLRRVLADIDGYAATMPDFVPVPAPLPAFTPRPGPRRLDLRRTDIATVIWATGFRPAYPWLSVPVLGADGLIRHRRGVTPAPGLYAIGLRFQHRRNSTFIDGARHDAAFIADHVSARRDPGNRARCCRALLA